MSIHRFTDQADWFQREEVGGGVFRITETYYREDYRCNIYVVLGEREDIVIDSGLGLGDLREYLRPLTESPLLVSSHAHYDHIGSNWQFERRLIHPAEAALVAAPNRQDTYADLLLATEDFARLPWPGWAADQWTPEPAPATGLLNEGDVLDLFDRQLAVLHTPGHSWGSICLWDEARGELFCADTVYQGEIFDALPCSDIPAYVQTMRRLRALPVRVAYPGHGLVLSGSEFRAVIDDYLNLKGATS